QRLLSKLYGLNVGISEHGARAKPLQIAPNPSAGQTVLSVGTPQQKGTLSIHDASGRVVWQEPWPAGTVTHTLKAGLLAPGTYLLRVQEEQGTLHTGKLIVLP
ncbi:MAG: T9SS type A sorting domain-containing protein, partial [Flavobacteriales bacterium]|nr:T9SS type A sorting domain-containing protein [Flavobacteriales bacterium]